MDEPATFGEVIGRLMAEAKISDTSVADWLGMEFTADIETDGSEWEDAAE